LLIINKNQAEEMGLDRWLVEADGFWTPAGKDITTREENIVEFFS
jgi:hypothetical protein